MKTLLAILLTLTLLAGAMVATLPITSADCDPNTDPTCKQQCPRDGECPCTWEPECTPQPTYAGKPTRTPPPVSTPEAGGSVVIVPSEWIDLFQQIVDNYFAGTVERS